MSEPVERKHTLWRDKKVHEQLQVNHNTQTMLKIYSGALGRWWHSGSNLWLLFSDDQTTLVWFNSKHPHCGSQLSVTARPWDKMPFSDLCGYCMHAMQIHICKQNIHPPQFCIFLINDWYEMKQPMKWDGLSILGNGSRLSKPKRKNQ